jgi:hypothetical protein
MVYIFGEYICKKIGFANITNHTKILKVFNSNDFILHSVI